MPRVVFRNRLDVVAGGNTTVEIPIGSLALTGRVPALSTQSEFYSGFTPTLYAAPADLGNGSGSSEANAMDFLTALTTVTAGGILGVLPGIYSGPTSGTDRVPVFMVANAGTVSNPIRVVCKYAAVYLATPETNANRTELRSSNPTVEAAIIGAADGNSHVHLYGFYYSLAHGAPSASEGGVMLSGGDGIHVEQFVMDGIYLGVSGVDRLNENWNLIFLSIADDAVIRNNLFRNLTWTGNHNCSVITMYGALNLLIEHNRFEDSYDGIFVKGSAESGAHLNSGTIRYNTFDGMLEHPIDVNAVEPTASLAVYQNLFVDCQNGLNLDDSSSGSYNANTIYSNNTIVNPTEAGWQTDTIVHTGIQWYNNIAYWSSSNALHAVQWDATPTRTLFNYNYYYESGGSVTWHDSPTTYTTIADWRTYTGTEANSSASTDPLFVNAASDWHLQGGSPALTAGNTGGPIGCYITGNEEIGVEAQ